ncbi:MAG: hypothetical protein AB7P07_02720 [Hyphomonadaceae bacterium]
MLILMTAFTIFHLAAGLASLALAVRLLAPTERAHWRSKRALLVAEAICWVYPALAFGAGAWAWRVFNAGGHHAFPIMLAPISWLLIMGLIFAIVDFAEDGILGNTRSRD